MSDLPAFSLDDLNPEVDDVQVRLLNNALRSFCDKVEHDEHTTDEEKNVATRDVVWQYGNYRFRAKVVTFAGQASIGQFDFTDNLTSQDWQRLTTPRALAEKLTEAKEAAKQD